ncbi:hypothetical protein GCM10027167_63010 [Nocardia heshunensis]
MPRDRAPVSHRSPMTWINDFCENARVDDPRRAEGILKIHAPCTPPCPRARAAAECLARHPHPPSH